MVKHMHHWILSVVVDEHHWIIFFYYLHNSQRRIHILHTLSTTRTILLPMGKSFSVQTKEQNKSLGCIIKTDEICAFNRHRDITQWDFQANIIRDPYMFSWNVWEQERVWGFVFEICLNCCIVDMEGSCLAF